MAQIIRITSEALQATVRRLLPSQQGFGEDLQASNVIQPIIDLTPTAEGSGLPEFLQTSLAKDSQTSFSLQENTTTNVISTPGFFRIIGYGSATIDTTAERVAKWDITDGTSTKTIAEYRNRPGLADEVVTWQFDFNVYLNAGEILQGALGAANRLTGTTRQIADITGNLVNPAGFTSQ